MGAKKPSKWSILQEKQLLDCRIYGVFEQCCAHPDGRKGHFFIIKGNSAVHVMPVTSENNILMVNQYRFGSQCFSWEFPGGVLNKDEDPIVGGLRELREETGYESSETILVGTCHQNPAIQNSQTYFLLAKECRPTAATKWDEYEEIEMGLFPVEKVFQMAQDGQIHHAVTLAAIFFLKNHLEGR